MERSPDFRGETEGSQAEGRQHDPREPSSGTSSAPACKPESPCKPKSRLRLILASLLCLLTLAATIPNLGHVDKETQAIRWGIEDFASIAILLTPLAVIFVGYGRSRLVEGVGWFSLIALSLLRFSY